MKRRGFTLLELLVSISVAGVLMLTCGVLMKIGSDDQGEVSRELAWEREAGMALEFLREDLAAAHHRVWHESRDEGACQAGWFILRSKSSQDPELAIGDLCAVGYALWDEELGSGQVSRCLVRRQQDSRTVMQAIRLGRQGRQEALWSMDGGDGGDGSVETLARGVLAFELWPLLKEGPDSWQPWRPELRDMPEAVELCLILASPRLQARLRTKQDWDQARSNSRQFGGEDIRELCVLIQLEAHAD